MMLSPTTVKVAYKQNKLPTRVANKIPLWHNSNTILNCIAHPTKSVQLEGYSCLSISYFCPYNFQTYSTTFTTSHSATKFLTSKTKRGTNTQHKQTKQPSCSKPQKPFQQNEHYFNNTPLGVSVCIKVKATEIR